MFPSLCASTVGGPDTASSLDLALDTRRVKLLKGLQKILLGPALTIPLDRMRIHSYMLIGVMLLTHVVAYVVVRRGVEVVNRGGLLGSRLRFLQFEGKTWDGGEKHRFGGNSYVELIMAYTAKDLQIVF